WSSQRIHHDRQQRTGAAATADVARARSRNAAALRCKLVARRTPVEAAHRRADVAIELRSERSRALQPTERSARRARRMVRAAHARAAMAGLRSRKSAGLRNSRPG